MNRISKIGKIVSTILVAFLVINKPVFAEPLDEQLQIQKSQLQKDKNELKKAQERSFEIEQQIENLDVKIETIMDEIQKNKNQINKAKEDIVIAEKEFKKAEEDIKSEQEIFNRRMRVMYIEGLGSYFELIFSSNGISDLISKVEAVKKVIEYDKKIISNLKLKQKEVNEKKSYLTEQNVKITVLNQENEKKITALNDDRVEQNKLIEEAKRQERIFASAVNEAQIKVNATLKDIQKIRDAAPKYVPSRGATTVSSNAVIAYASNFLGTPYRWGGTTPAGFDCSGFTQYVYRHFGISLGRTTYDQIKNGVGVSRDQLQPGDLMFFGKGGNPTHMGIYVGNGMYIHSPRTGDVLKISPTTRSDYITSRRVM